MRAESCSSFPILALLLAATCASTLSAQGQPETKIARDIPELHDLKTAPEPVLGKPWQPPVPLDQQASRPGKPMRAGIPFVYGTAGLGAHGSARDRVLYDDRADGTIWADGENYKASFAADGFTFVPFLGSDAPKDYPVRMTVRSARVGTHELEIRLGVAPVRTGDRIVFDRGALLEVYDLKPNGVEQTFRVVETGWAGAVRVDVAVESELAEDAALPGIQFGNSLGRVEYGAAAVVRENGDKLPIATTFVNGVISLEVEESQRDGLGRPVTIDPLVSTFVPSSMLTGYTNTNADIAYDHSTDTYLMVWERVFSSTDSDVFCEARTRTGTYVANSSGVVDSSSSESWSKPRVANLNLYDSFLTVAQVYGTPKVIKGRIRQAALPVTTGSQFQVSGSESGDKLDPDVGGDPSTSPDTYWTVVYRRDYSPTDSDIHARQIESTGTLHGATILLSNSNGTLDVSPQISNSNGSLGAISQRWMVVWTRVASPADHDVYGASLTWEGGVATPPFPIDASTEDDVNPTVSSPADAWSGAAGYMVAWERASTAHIHGRVMTSSGLTIAGLTDLTLLAGPSSSNGFQPNVDSDGSKFSMGFYDGKPGYVATFHVAYGKLGATEPRMLLKATGDIWQTRLCSVHGSGGVNLDYGIAFTDVSTTQYTVGGVVYMGLASGGFFKRPTGCGGLSITAAGIACIGRAPTYTVTNVGADLVGMLLGVPSNPVTLCGSCALGILPNGPIVNFPNLASVTLTIPTQGALIGSTFSIQGYAIGTPTCFSTVRLGDTMDSKVQ